MFILFSLCMLYYQRISSSFILDDAMTFSYVEIRDEKIELPMNMWFTGFMMQCNKIFMTWLNLGDFCENEKNIQKENIMRTMLALKHVKFIAGYKSISYLLKGHCISQCNVASIRHKWNFKP